MFWETYSSLCKSKNESPTGVAQKLGLTNAACSKWKKGTIPNGTTLQIIANYFGVTTGYLLGETEPQSADPTKDPAILELSQIAELLSKTDYGLTRLNFLLEEARRMQENVKKLAELESQHSQPKSTAETL